MDFAAMRRAASEIRKRTRDVGVIELCDFVLGLPDPGRVVASRVEKAVPAKSLACPVCAERRAKKAAAQKRWRAKRRRGD